MVDLDLLAHWQAIPCARFRSSSSSYYSHPRVCRYLNNALPRPQSGHYLRKSIPHLQQEPRPVQGTHGHHHTLTPSLKSDGHGNSCQCGAYDHSSELYPVALDTESYVVLHMCIQLLLIQNANQTELIESALGEASWNLKDAKRPWMRKNDAKADIQICRRLQIN